MKPSIFLLFMTLALALQTHAQQRNKSVTVLKLDNSIVSGEMTSLSEKRVVVRISNGSEVIIGIEEIHELVFDGPRETAQAVPPAEPPKPRNVTVDSRAFVRCVNAFRRIVSAVELGVSYADYRQELLEAKLLFDESIGSLPESEQRTDLIETMSDLRLAADAWQVGIQYDGIPTKDDFYRRLNARYDFGVSPRLGLKVNYSAVLKIIWAKASSRLEHAISLQP